MFRSDNITGFLALVAIVIAGAVVNLIALDALREANCSLSQTCVIERMAAAQRGGQ